MRGRRKDKKVGNQKREVDKEIRRRGGDER
jgi:hypothetical protein